MKKRGAGEGTIWKDREKPERWHGQIQLPSGVRKNVYGEKRREVQEKMAQLRREIDAGMHGTRDAEQTLAQFLQSYLDGHRHALRSKTIQGYDGMIRQHMDGIGTIPLSKLKPNDLQKHYTKKLQTLKPTTVTHIHAFIHLALKHAVRLGVIPRNPADFVDAPGIRPSENVQVMTAEETTRFLAAAKTDRLVALWMLALATGMREGELLGLRWQDVDIAGRRIAIAVTLHPFRGGRFTLEAPKSATSARRLPLAHSVAEALITHKIQQEEEAALCGEAWANAFDLVFTTQTGTPIRYDHLIRQFRRVLKTAAIDEKTRIHDLRHTFATLLLERGVDIKTVSELLGHSSVTITAVTYAHVTRGMRLTAITEINSLVPMTISGNTAEPPDP